MTVTELFGVLDRERVRAAKETLNRLGVTQSWVADRIDRNATYVRQVLNLLSDGGPTLALIEDEIEKLPDPEGGS